MNGMFGKRARAGALAWIAALVVTAAGGTAYAGTGAWTGGGPEGGDVSAIVADPNSGANLFAATRGASHGGAGVFFSDSRGRSWSPRNHGLTHREVNALVAASSMRRTVLYAGTLYGGVFRSNDLGASWTRASSGLTNLDVLSLAVDRGNASIVYAATYGGMFATADGGASWQPASNGLANLVMTTVLADPVRLRTLYATGSGGVFLTTDRGGSWQPFAEGLDGSRVETIAISPNGERLYAATSRSVFSRDLTLSGTEWVRLGALPLQVFNIRTIAADRFDPATLYAGGAALAVTHDGGASWSAMPDAPTWSNALVQDPRDGAFYAGNADGFHRYDAAAGWLAFNRGLHAQMVNALASSPIAGGVAYAGTHAGGLFRTTDGGSSWTPLRPFMPGEPRLVQSVAIDPSDANIVYAGANMGGLYTTTDGGAQWTSLAVPCSDVHAIAIAPSVVYAAGFCQSGSVLRSTDAGATWTNVLTATVRSIAIDPSDSSIVYAAGAVIFKTTDGGASWTPLQIGISVASLTLDGEHLFATGDAGQVRRSDDGGASWQPADAGLPTVPLHDLVIAHGTLYVATEGEGVWSSNDGGASWHAFNDDALNPDVLALAADGAGRLYAGTAGSVYEREE